MLTFAICLLIAGPLVGWFVGVFVSVCDENKSLIRMWNASEDVSAMWRVKYQDAQSRIDYLKIVRSNLLERIDDQQGTIIHLSHQLEDLSDSRDALARDNRKMRVTNRANESKINRLLDKLVEASMKITEYERTFGRLDRTERDRAPGKWGPTL